MEIHFKFWTVSAHSSYPVSYLYRDDCRLTDIRSEREGRFFVNGAPKDDDYIIKEGDEVTFLEAPVLKLLREILPS